MVKKFDIHVIKVLENKKKIFEVVENVKKLMKDVKPQIQDSLQTPKKIQRKLHVSMS